MIKYHSPDGATAASDAATTTTATTCMCDAMIAQYYLYNQSINQSIINLYSVYIAHTREASNALVR